MKINKICHFILICTIIQSCKKENKPSSNRVADKPIISEQIPENPQHDDLSLEELIFGKVNPEKPSQDGQNPPKPHRFGSNIFDSECNLNSIGYNNCSFNKIDLNHYSIKMQNEFNFTVNYEFKNCNFDYLNAEFYTLKDSHKITSATNKVTLTGNSIYIKDPYVWDTKTNEYSPTCHFVINDIQASLSTYTINRLEGYIKLISEYKTILQMSSNLEILFYKLNSLVNQLNSNDVSYQLNAIEEELKLGLNKYNDPVWKTQVKLILSEIEQFKAQENFPSDQIQLRNQITEKIKDLIIDINTNNINESINLNKQKALAILKELSLYSNYDDQQYVKYKKILEM